VFLSLCGLKGVTLFLGGILTGLSDTGQFSMKVLSLFLSGTGNFECNVEKKSSR